MFELGDIVYVENSFTIYVPAIIVDIEINEEANENDKWYRVIFFGNNELLWYHEQEVRRNANR